MYLVLEPTHQPSSVDRHRLKFMYDFICNKYTCLAAKVKAYVDANFYFFQLLLISESPTSRYTSPSFCQSLLPPASTNLNNPHLSPSCFATLV